MKRSAITLAVPFLTFLMSVPTAALAANYPAIKPKNRAYANADHSFFEWILNNFPWVLLGIVLLCFAGAIIFSVRRKK